jgi:2-dehydropantoate 2-reductase
VTTITLIGPGAIGCTLAAWLSQNPSHQLALAVRTPLDSLEVTTPSGVITAKPRILTNPSQARPADWVLVTTKAYDSAAAATWFATACGPKTRLAVIQNGVEHVERFAPHFDARRIVPVMIDCPAERTAAGRAIQRGPIRMVVPDGENGADFLALFSRIPAEVSQTPDFVSAVWRKLCLNSAGAVSAVVLAPAGIVHHEGVAELMRAIIRECIAVGRALGATLEDGIAEDIVARARKGPRNAGNSMYADRRAGRPMEIDARNGVIVRLGNKHGIAAPMNALMVAMLEAAQAAQAAQDDSGPARARSGCPA